MGVALFTCGSLTPQLCLSEQRVLQYRIDNLCVLQGRKIFVLDLGIFAESAGLPPCSIETTFRVDPITNVPFLRNDPQVCKLLNHPFWEA